MISEFQCEGCLCLDCEKGCFCRCDSENVYDCSIHHDCNVFTCINFVERTSSSSGGDK